MQLNEYQIFNRYFNGGAYALPFLLKFSCPGCSTLYFVNNTESIEFEGNIYHHASFEYAPPDSNGKGANLRISGADKRLKQYIHFYGTVSYSENMELNFELGTDDRLEMTFPPYKFDAETNKGNT